MVRHMADAPAVNVWANGSPLSRGRQFDWGSMRGWDVPEGDYEVFVSLARQSDPVIGLSTCAQAGFRYQVYAWGNGTAGYGLIVIPLESGEKRPDLRTLDRFGAAAVGRRPSPRSRQDVAAGERHLVDRLAREHPSVEGDLPVIGGDEDLGHRDVGHEIAAGEATSAADGHDPRRRVPSVVATPASTAARATKVVDNLAAASPVPPQSGP